MRKAILIPLLGSAIAAWSLPAQAGETVVLPGVVGAVGVTSGVYTQGSGTLTVGEQNINTSNAAGGAVTTTAANTASINFTGNSIVTGAVGASGSTFLNINAGANGKTDTFNGAVYSTTLELTGTGTLNFNQGFVSNSGSTADFGGDGVITVGAGQTFKAAVTNTAGADTGTLVLNNGAFVDGAVGAASGLKAITLASGNAAIGGQAQAFTFNLGTNTLNVGGALAIPVGGVINTTIFSPTLYGKIVPAGAATIGTGLQVHVIVTGPIAAGSSFNIVDATSGTSGSTVIATSTTPRYQFSAAPTVNGTVKIITTQIPLAVVVAPVTGGTPVVSPIAPVVIAPAVDALPVTTATTPVLVAISTLPTAAAIANALAQLAPATANVESPRGAYLANRQFLGLLQSHLDATQADCGPRGDRYTGASDADDQRACHLYDRDSHFWAAFLGYDGEQGAFKGFEGDTTSILGGVVGVDSPIAAFTRMGAALSYARSKIEGKSSDALANVDSYHATVYLTYTPGAWYANASVGYGFDDYTGARHIVFPGVDSIAKAQYSGDQYSAALATGYHIYLGDGRTVLTPSLGVQYTRLNTDAYGETGAGAIDLLVASQRYNFVDSDLGLKLARNIAFSGGSVLRPQVHIGWRHSFSDDAMQNTATFEGGGTAFTVAGLKPQRDLFDAGGGFTLASHGAWSVEGVYDYQWRQDSFSAQQAMIKVVFSLGAPPSRQHRD
jgi:outer membrane autotransporter protein